MIPIATASAGELADLVRRRQIGCLELLDAAIARVERLDGALNAVVVRDFDRARTHAKALDQGPPTGPLHGVPMTVKESFDIAGLPTTWGFPDAARNIAQIDALAVSRLRAAGAVIYGKTNVPKGLADWQSYNAIYGATANPWNHARTPGGSSGGSAAAVAAGLSALEMGSDIGGSVRVPAHFCGVFGHKPTWGLLPMRGHALAGPGAPADISAIGPFARAAADLGTALDLLAIPDPLETGLRHDLPPGPVGLRGLRVAVWAKERATHTDAATTAAILGLADDLERAGARVDRAARPDFDPAESMAIYVRLLAAALSGRQSDADIARMREAASQLRPDDHSADAIMLRATDMTHRAWLADNGRRFALRRAWNAFFRDWDVLLCPAFGVPALPRTEQGETWERTTDVDGVAVPYNDMLFWPGLTGGVHLPATVAPIARSPEGLPIGVQIVGRLYADRTTIAVAGLIETLTGGFVAPPGLD
jgi:amidase